MSYLHMLSFTSSTTTNNALFFVCLHFLFLFQFLKHWRGHCLNFSFSLSDCLLSFLCQLRCLATLFCITCSLLFCISGSRHIVRYLLCPTIIDIQLSFLFSVHYVTVKQKEVFISCTVSDSADGCFSLVTFISSSNQLGSKMICSLVR